MVLHDRSEEEAWVSARVAREEQKKKKQPKENTGRLSVVAVQSIACAVVLLLALLLRTAGGEAYEQLRRGFHAGLMRNDLLAALATLWDGDPLAAESVPPDTDTDGESVSPTAEEEIPGRLPPSGTLAVALRVNRWVVPPLSSGTLTSGYGYRTDPTGGGEQFHRGVDIAAPAGSPIAAMYDGRVAAVGESASLGRYIRIDHGDGVEVLYAHCAEIIAPQGAAVRAGERVALVGSSGDSTGNHVHVQVSADGVVYNPAGTVPLSRYV